MSALASLSSVIAESFAHDAQQRKSRLFRNVEFLANCPDLINQSRRTNIAIDFVVFRVGLRRNSADVRDDFLDISLRR